MSIYQILAICGMTSPIVYTLMWILGGYLRSDYSHIRDDISSLTAVGAPRKRLFDTFIITSSVLLFVFYLGLHGGINNGQGSIVGPIFLLASSVLGILVAFFFPLDAGGEIITFRGKMHVVLVVAMGLLTIGGMVALWLRLALVEGWSTFATFSLISAIFSSILVIISIILAKSKYMGLVERIMVTPYQIYYFVISLMVFLTN
ncbi:MAG: DUF998 domain-containing protein [Candidatus Hodarchaeales archaeon]|jgi:hypothetical protein